MKKIRLLSIWTAIIFAACNNQQNTRHSSNINFNFELGIETVPSNLGKQFTDNFNRYTKVVAPNGKPIHIVAQDDLTEEQIVRCRNILIHFLTDYPGSKYGHDKSAVANKMAENKAILALLDGQDDGKNKTEVPAQYLFKNEIQVEGHPWYINQNYEHRDAAFEEILHLVHDFGIGVDGHNSMPGAALELQREIRAAQVNGLDNKLWADDERAIDWIVELDEENSLSQEYLASLIDTHYGLWGAWDGKSRRGEARDTDKGMWGLYVAKTRDQLQSRDPMGHELMNNKFFHPHLTYNARIDEDFKGTFSLAFNPSISYTHHSRYLKDITLVGNQDTKVRINELDNDVTGNDGFNIAIFSGKLEAYMIDTSSSKIIIEDQVEDRDGKNTLQLFEALEFSDQTVQLPANSELIKIGGFLRSKPYNKDDVDFSDYSVEVEDFDVPGFPKKMQTYGTIFAIMEDVPKEFLVDVATTFHQMFPQDPTLNLDLQHKVLETMRHYHSTIPVLKGRYENMSFEVTKGFDVLQENYSVCDIIMYQDGTGRQTMEVVEHLLHFATSIGFQIVMPDVWGYTNPRSRVNQVMKIAVDKRLYQIEMYDDILEEDEESYHRVLIQEFAYWLITSYWNLQEPYGPLEEEEWNIDNRKQLLEKLPEGYKLVEETVANIMKLPSMEILERFKTYQ